MELDIEKAEKLIRVEQLVEAATAALHCTIENHKDVPYTRNDLWATIIVLSYRLIKTAHDEGTDMTIFDNWLEEMEELINPAPGLCNHMPDHEGVYHLSTANYKDRN